jgi:hypothetical protein
MIIIFTPLVVKISYVKLVINKLSCLWCVVFSLFHDPTCFLFNHHVVPGMSKYCLMFVKTIFFFSRKLMQKHGYSGQAYQSNI